MSKVECLKKIISKLTGEELNDPELDTICECLDKLSEVVSTAGGGSGTPGKDGKDGKDGTKWFVMNENLMTGSNAPSGAKEGDLVLDNQGDVLVVIEDLTLAGTGVNLKA